MCVALRTGLQAWVSGKALQKFSDGWHYQICSKERACGCSVERWKQEAYYEAVVITQAKGDDGGLTLRTSKIEENGFSWQIIG